ncbi:MAG: helix-hairpin-helix domain-containing protein [Thiothrix sp.]|uniref:ComEA family DNA-binding protein n=1 Tax=Thiothrix sp. TaxID=1032 RepID=UPI002637CE90|nr:helix-hairpin-helix domain-containing protein [Thiothrix sp.]MDD5393811.1 helix-hairpin-helix domain-containing protein [Thiothrix sp.]
MKRVIFTATLLASLFAPPAAFAEMVNINKADAATFDTLDGIGAKKAEAIVTYRTEHGEFKTLEDLKEVKGIGDKLFDKIKADISLTEGASTVAETSSKEKVADKAETSTDSKTDKADAKAAPADKVSDKGAAKADKS